MSREELGIDPDELGGSPWAAAASSFLLFAMGAIVPVLPFALVHGAHGTSATWVSLAASAAGLFVIGFFITLFTGRGVLYTGGAPAPLRPGGRRDHLRHRTGDWRVRCSLTWHRSREGGRTSGEFRR